MAAHAFLSASAAGRWLKCAGSPWLEKPIKEKPNAPAMIGTAAHSVSEYMQRDGYSQEDALALLENKYLKLLETENVDMHEFFNAIYTYIDWMNARIEEKPDARVSYEQKVDLSFIAPGMFGTADFVSADLFALLDVGDYKHGSGVVVEIETDSDGLNAQGAYYALATAHRWAYNFEEVRVSIIQPRAYHVEGSIRSRTVPMENFRLEWTERFTEGARKVQEAKSNPEAHLVPGEGQCRFCKVRSSCPEIRKKTYELAQMDFDPITLENSVVPVSVQPSKKQLPEPSSLTMDQLVTVLDHAGMIDAWIKAVNQHAEHLLESKVKVPGYKLVPKRPTRKWINEKKVLTALKRRKTLTPEDYLADPKLLSPNQFEQRQKRDNPKLWAAMQKHIEKKSSGLTMAREDDKRPATEHLKAKDDFEAVKAPSKTNIPLEDV